MSKLISYLLSSAAAEFGDSLAKRLSTLYPVALDKPGAKKVSANRMASILERLYADARSYRHAHHLGYIGRARMSHAFKWRLLEIGYSKEVIDMATEGLVVYLYKPKTGTSPEKAASK